MLLVKGQRVRLSELTASKSLEVNLTLKLTGPGPLRHVVVGLNAAQKISDPRFLVAATRPGAPAGAIRLVGPGLGESADYLVNLDALPASVPRLLFASLIAGPGSFNQLAYGHLRLSHEGRELARLVVSGHDFTIERSLILGQLYLHNGEWRLSFDGQGFVERGDGLFERLGAPSALEWALAPLPAPCPPPDQDSEVGPCFDDYAWPEEAAAQDEAPPTTGKPRLH
jgi:stress response protein SCP2